MVEQFGLVTIAPGQPLVRRCSPINFKWSALTSGINSGTERIHAEVARVG
jgi:hypothetical protein